MHMYIYICISIYTHMCIFLYTCVYIYIYTYEHDNMYNVYEAAEDVLWAQRPDGVFLTIDLNEAQEIKAGPAGAVGS